MLKLKYIGEEDIHDIDFDIVNDNIVKITGNLPAKTNGFTISREEDNVTQSEEGEEAVSNWDGWDYSSYTTVYKELDGAILFSNDGSVYEEPIPTVRYIAGFGGELEGYNSQKVQTYEDLDIPTPVAKENYEFTEWFPKIPTEGKIESDMIFTAMFVYIPTLKEVQEEKVEEMNAMQQTVIQQGVDVRLTDGTTEHFTLTDQDQASLMALQSQVEQGAGFVPWHNANQENHCKYYKNADMAIIVQSALSFVIYQVTYFRDLRIYIRSLQTKEEVAAVTYGMPIPEAYQSQVLKDMLAQMNA